MAPCRPPALRLPLDHPGLPWPIAIRSHPKARRLRLRLDPDNHRLLLTCPPRSSRKAAIDWAVGQRPWVEAELAKLPPGNPFAPGETIPFEGVETRLDWDSGTVAPGASRWRPAGVRRSARGVRAPHPGLAQAPCARRAVDGNRRRRRTGRGDDQVGRDRRCVVALGKLLGVGRDPLQLAAGARPVSDVVAGWWRMRWRTAST